MATILIIVVQTSCQNNTQTKSIAENSTPVEDFDEFYNKFHSDSSFQMSRVHFPLEGGIYDSGQDSAWTKANYRILKTRIYDVDTTEFKVSFTKTDSTFTEKVWLEDSGYSSEYKFHLINKLWYLVYAVDAND
jgi:hypothetical protein